MIKLMKSRVGTLCPVMGLVLLISFFPAGAARADLGDNIAIAVGQILDAINGLDLPPVELEFDYEGVSFTFTVVGVALCDPPFPNAEPNLTPDPPYNSYGCENVSDVDVEVVPAGDTADISITIENLFVDFEMEREYGICVDTGPPFYIPIPPCDECDSGDPIDSEGYLLISNATVALSVEIDYSEACPTVSIVPGSVQTTSENTDIVLDGDPCIELSLLILGPVIEPMIEEGMSTALELFLTESTSELNDAICALPENEASWGDVKRGYGSGN